MNKNILYLAAHTAKLENDDNVVYNDLIIPRDLHCDMMEVDLSSYELIFATPPCNYYSRANYRRNISEYSLNTKHLLPNILKKLLLTNSFFIVENVRNEKLFIEEDVIPTNIIVITHGRHTYFTNILNISTFVLGVPQVDDNVIYKKSSERQGGPNVNNVFNSIKNAFEENLLIKY